MSMRESSVEDEVMGVMRGDVGGAGGRGGGGRGWLWGGRGGGF